MGFEITKAETRVANLITWFAGLQSRITDFVVGSKVRTKFEAIAVEMERQDFEVERLVRKAIPTSTYLTFNFTLLPATRAYGEVTFTAAVAPSSDITIAAGTRIATTATTTSDEKVYETLTAATIQTGGTTVTTQVVCSVAGTNGNTGSGTVNVLKTAISGVTSVSNTNPIAGGTEIETEEARRIRFNSYVSTLTRGTSTALAYGAKTAALYDGNGVATESVTSVAVSEPPGTGSAGSCSIYIYNGSTGASADLVTECQKIIDGYDDSLGNPVAGYKAAGIVATVVAATTLSTTCTASISMYPGYDADTIQASAETATTAYFASLGVGDRFIRHELAQRIMSIDGVYNLDLTAPASDVEPSSSQVPISGTVTYTVSEQIF